MPDPRDPAPPATVPSGAVVLRPGDARTIDLGGIGVTVELAPGIAAGMAEAGLDEIVARYAMEIVGPVPEGYL